MARSDLFEIYERRALDAVVAGAQEFLSQPLLIDCGADTGLYTRLALFRGLSPHRTIAIEPNTRTFDVLRRNVDQFDVQCVHGCVGAKPGIGTLVEPSYDPQDRAGYLQPGIGDIEIHTVDDLVAQMGAGSNCIVLKIDVEGSELDAICGAAETLSTASQWIVQFEAHPTVSRRSGIDPIECLAKLITLGGASWISCEEDSGSTFPGLRPELPFFDQLPGDRIFDVVVSNSTTTFDDRL